jgi:hypothetical protein
MIATAILKTHAKSSTLFDKNFLSLPNNFYLESGLAVSPKAAENATYPTLVPLSDGNGAIRCIE